MPTFQVGSPTEALRADPTRHTAILARIPAGRYGEPEDFKGAILFLASRAPDYVNRESSSSMEDGWGAECAPR
jgi:2-dehydro-3-deoxy-D-gluconate 5-dehydrogenase